MKVAIIGAARCSDEGDIATARSYAETLIEIGRSDPERAAEALRIALDRIALAGLDELEGEVFRILSAALDEIERGRRRH